MRFSDQEIAEFLQRFPRMRLRPTADGSVTFEGHFEFEARVPGQEPLRDSYRLRLWSNNAKLNELPTVTEIDGRIPQKPEFHVNDDGTMCLGSPLRLAIALAGGPPLARFVDRCLVPFLYDTSRRLAGEEGFLFGELQHGGAGIVQDYEDLLGVRGVPAIRAALRALTLRKRVANKQPCPCACGKSLGRCKTRLKINPLRKLMARAHFSEHLKYCPDVAKPLAPKRGRKRPRAGSLFRKRTSLLASSLRPNGT